MGNCLRLLCATAMCAYTMPALAQNRTGSASANQSLEEIIVTAQKREQSLQDVPVAVTAITADTLTSRNVSTVTDLPRLAPSLTVTESNTPANNSIILRGIGTFAFSVGVEPSVAVIVDDVALLQQSQAFSGLSDIARIEVLRGPQGTLFGRAAAAGAINIVSQTPTDDFTGSAGGTLTTDGQYRGEAVLSGPLAPGVKFRVNGFYDWYDGNIRNLENNRMLNHRETYGVRGRLAIEPASTLKIDLIGAYSIDNTNGTIRPFVVVPAGATIVGTPLAPYFAGITPGIGNRAIRVDVEPYNRTKQFVGSGRATLDLGGVDLTAVTSYQDWRFTFLEDFDMTTVPILGSPKGISAGGPFHARQFTQELRLSSKGRRTLDYVVGLYYSNGRTYRAFDRQPVFLAKWRGNSGVESMAAFTQATLNLGTGTHIDGGLRFNRQIIDVAFLNQITPATPPANNATCLSECTGKDSDNAVTGKIALRQDLARSVMAYASFATGYKGSGFDVSTGFTPARAAAPVHPEKSHAYEVGLKSRFLDNRVQLNIAGFWTDYKDYQAQSGVQQPDGTFNPVLNNVGRLRTRGVEIEASAKPTPALRIDGALSYTDAKVRSYPNAPCFAGQTAAQGCIDLDGAGPGTTTGQDLSGARLSNAPKVKWNIGATYDIELPSMPFNAFVQADFNYQSKVNFDLSNNPATVQPGYGILNASFGIRPSGSRGMSVAVFVNNVFDKHYAAALFPTVGTTTGTLAGVLPRQADRYAGLRVRYGF